MKTSGKKKQDTGATIQPFASNLEYLAALVDYVQALALQRVAERRLEETTGGDGDAGRNVAGNRPQRRAPHGFTTYEVVRVIQGSRGSRRAQKEPVAESRPVLLERVQRRGCERQLLYDRWCQRTAHTLAAGKVALPLEALAQEHGLCEFEKLVIAVALVPSLSTRVKNLIGDLMEFRHGGMEVGDLLELLCPTIEAKISARRHFICTAPLLGKGLLNLAFHQGNGSEAAFMHMDVELPRRISSHILGEFDIDDQVISFSSVIDPEVDLAQVVLPPGRKEEVLQLVTNREEYLRCRREWGFDRVLSYGKGTILLFAGPSGSGKTMLAHALAKATGNRLMLVDIRKVINHSRSDFEENLQRVFHEARLQHAIIFFDEADEMFSDRAVNGAMPTLLREFEKLDGIAILATNRRSMLDDALERRILYKLEFEVPSPELREAIWRNHLPAEAPLAADIDLKTLAEEFEFTGGFIKNAVLVAMNRALQRPASERRITQGDLRFAAQTQRRNRLEAHTDKVTPRVSLADVVLPSATARQVGAFLDAARKRSTVFSTWGFAKKMSMGKALSALFSGESGVGKSMTAEAIAFELGQPLHPVKLHTVISEFVGQTEKNLAALFKEAQEAQALLLIDEADALFSARLNEGNHHARYINQQVNTLLTQIEKYDGIVILATNRAADFDPAFERRIRYRVQFPKPDAAARAAIWRGMLPPEAPVAGEIDFAALGRDFEFTGGTIKNVVLRAAFDAATRGEAISEELLRRSATAETPLKIERTIGFRAA